MYPTDDTIVALSTAPFPSAVAVIRISGPRAFAILAQLFRPRPTRASGAPRRQTPPRVLAAGSVLDETGRTLDEVLTAQFPAPHSYTGEDLAEIHCHGNPFIAAKIISLATQDERSRPAERGEFTYRAFLNGKLDLTQAEAVLGVIESKSDFALDLNLSQLKGRLGKTADAWKKAIVDILATIEANLDYPDEAAAPEIPKAILDLKTRIDAAVKKSAENLSAEIPVVIVGKPNVGKSSLFNALAREELAIVTHIAGTTTDILAETLHWDGLAWKIHDTAGISSSAPADLIEKIGRERAGAKILEARAAILVLDGSAALDENDFHLAETIKKDGKPAVIVVNKSDLPPAFGTDIAGNLFEGKAPVVSASAITGKGDDELKSALTKIALGNTRHDAAETIIANIRQKQSLEKCSAHLADALSDRKAGEEITAHHLRLAADALGELLGEITPDEILGGIFSRFCVGK